MYCTKCGIQNSDNAWKCTSCGEALSQASPASPPQKIPNYLAQSILVTLFCCLPFGIAAIVYAAQVNSKVQSGDIEGALAASNKAKMWGWISFGLGLAGAIIYAVLMGLGAAASR